MKLILLIAFVLGAVAMADDSKVPANMQPPPPEIVAPAVKAAPSPSAKKAAKKKSDKKPVEAKSAKKS